MLSSDFARALYLNVTSVVVSSTILLYATIADVRDRAAAKRADEIAKNYERVLEDRIQERAEIAKTYETLLEEHIQGREEIAKAYEQVLEERVQADHVLIQQILHNSIENILGGRLEKIRVEDHNQLEAMQKAVIASNEALRAELAEKALIASNEALRAELAELRGLVQALHQSHYVQLEFHPISDETKIIPKNEGLSVQRRVSWSNSGFILFIALLAGNTTRTDILPRNRISPQSHTPNPPSRGLTNPEQIVCIS